MTNRAQVADAFVVKDTTNPGKSKNGPEDEWIPGTAGITTSTVEISISCRNLSDKDIMSKSDPMVVIYHRPPGSTSWVQLRRTEVIRDNLNPDFAKKVTIKYKFEQVQMMRFEVYDIDSEKARLSSQESIGMVECTLGQIVSAGDDGLHLELTSMKPSILSSSNRPPGTIILIAEEVPSEKDEVNLKLVGQSCGSWLGCIPPKTYFSISKSNCAGIYLVVHRSRSSRGTRPNWPPLRISSRLLCNGDMKRDLKIEVFQRKFTGNLTSIGFCITNLGHLLSLFSQDRIPLRREDGGDCKAAIRINACTLTPINTFVDYIQSGTIIQCSFAIDFTCSNGDPEEPESLHYVSSSSNQPNPYEQAISSVGNIVKDYDNTYLFPCYGFGARLPPNGDISHLFPVTLSNAGPNCGTIQGVLEAYRACIGKIYLYGPTNFAPVINCVAERAARNQSGEHYHILVIVTDGVISDMVKTKKVKHDTTDSKGKIAIVEASAYPMSIIIIGVGEADFDAMQELDGDAVRITYKGKKAQRDIVQFVAYRSAKSWLSHTGETTGKDVVIGVPEDVAAAGAKTDGAGGTTAPGSTGSVNEGLNSYPGTAPTTPMHPASGSVDPNATNLTGIAAPEDKEEKTNRIAQSQLAQEVLLEIPDQVTGYMKSRGILPAAIKQKNQQQQELEKKVKAAMGEGEDGTEDAAPATSVPGAPPAPPSPAPPGVTVEIW